MQVCNIPLLSQLAFLCLRRTTLVFLFLPLLTASIAAGATFPNCDHTFTCGSLQNITYPFTGGARPHYCGPPQFQLTCHNDTHTELTTNSVTYRVLSIDQTLKTLTLAASDFYNTTCPTKFTNSTLDSTVFAYGDSNQDLNLVYGCSRSRINYTPYNQFSCELSEVNYTDAFYLVGPVPVDPILQGITQCNVTVETKVNGEAAQQLTGNQTTLREALISGFSVNYSDPYGNQCSNCSWSGGSCGFDSDSNLPICICGDVQCVIPTITLSSDSGTSSPGSSDTGRNNSALILGIVVSIGGIITILLLYIIVKKLRQSEFIFFWKTKTENYRNVEAFLKNCGSLSIKRYTYSDIKKITGSFRTNLGQGGFGCVYKGKLENGCLVAVKVLKGLKGNGDEFINEVATISRTSHVHIVTLLGFCFDSCHRALIYEFMPNGSLDRFIHNGSSLTNQQLGWEALYQIAVGIAQGLEYLHRGCNTRILHFDIKPHNILLNEDFCPKISDFGLAKLCPQKESIISLVGTRGTAGYIAPEVFSRNFGEVSHKSDVYSYGMMVLEMVGARKNINVEVDHTSEIYFPHWIYKRLELDEELGLHEIMGDEAKTIARKMIIVGLWCIQTDPSHRPPMRRVLEMLEGSLESLQIPPKPFLSSPSRAPVYSSTTQSTLMS